MIEFQPFAKIPRLSRPCVITEKLDGTNASVTITEEGEFLTGSRTRWITPENDNYGFARWANEHKEELLKLGVGTHFGEWWGQGIQRRYDLPEKRWSLFNVAKWGTEERPACCSVVPVLYEGPFCTERARLVVEELAASGSKAAPGFMKPEGIVIFHCHGHLLFKKTIEKDEAPKGMVHE